METLVGYPAMTALIAVGRDFPTSLKNLFESLVSMREASKNNGRAFDAWFMRITSDTEKDVWIEAKHAGKTYVLKWGRYDPMTTYHLFIEESCVCAPQQKEADVSHWMDEEETVTDGKLCIDCYRKLLMHKG